MGKFNYGHTGVAGVGYGNADSGFVAEEAVWTYQATDIADYDEKHHRAGCLSNNSYIHSVICRYVLKSCIQRDLMGMGGSSAHACSLASSIGINFGLHSIFMNIPKGWNTVIPM